MCLKGGCLYQATLLADVIWPESLEAAVVLSIAVVTHSSVKPPPSDLCAAMFAC